MGKKSAGVLLLREERGEIMLLALVGRHSWDLPKGGIEKNETPKEAAIRELQEEAGTRVDSWLLSEPFECSYKIKKGSTKTVYLFAGVTGRSSVTISKEHESYKWVNLKEAKDLLPKRFKKALEWLICKVEPHIIS